MKNLLSHSIENDYFKNKKPKNKGIMKFKDLDKVEKRLASTRKSKAKSKMRKIDRELSDYDY